MGRAFRTSWLRSVGSSVGRFLAIVIIVAVGCGFFAGLRMAGVGMRKSADAYFDRTRLFDLEVVSTLGLTDEDVDRLLQVEGVSGAMGCRSVDVMASFGQGTRTMRITSLPGNGADIGKAVSSEGQALNLPTLVEGRWPQAPDECVLLHKEADKGQVPERVEVLYGSGDLDDVLSAKGFKVVGLVDSPLYGAMASLGSTTLGSGTIEQVAFVGAGSFQEDSPYTEVYLTVDGASDKTWGDSDYQGTVDVVADRVEQMLPALGEARVEALKAEGQKTLDEKRAELDSAAEEADRSLEEGRRTLAENRAKLDEGSQALLQGQATLDAKGQELADGRARLQNGWETLRSQGALLAQGEEALDQGQKTLDAQRTELAQGKTQWAEADGALKAQEASVAQAREAATAYEGAVGSLVEAAEAAGIQGDTPEAIAQGATTALEGLRAQQAQGTPGLEESIAALEKLQGSAQVLADQAPKVDQARQAVAAYDEGRAQLDAKAEELEEGERALTAAEAELDGKSQELAQGRDSLAQGEAELAQGEEASRQGEEALASAQAQLNSRSQELAQGRESLAQGEAELAQAQDEASTQLAEGERKLADAQAELDSMEEPDLFLLDRTKTAGVESFRSDSIRIDAIATVFPFFFFVVAALVSLTTMTRMVEDERGLMGTFKAMGYGTAAICGRYLAYAGAASALGALLGILSMAQLLPWVILQAYSIVYAIPARPFPLPVEWEPAVMAALIGIGVTLGATLAAALASLRETPASLIQPKAPKAGRRILLERVGPLWSRLSFSWKVTCRNIFRYKRRFAMTVVGIAGCTALLLTGFGVRDAINDIIDVQFGELIHYDLTVGLDPGASSGARDAVESYLTGRCDPGMVCAATTENVIVRQDEADSDHRSVVVVPQGADFDSVVTLRGRQDHRRLTLEGQGCIVTEKLATILGLGVGDSLEVYAQDSAGRPIGEPRAVAIDAIAENYLGTYLYMTPEAYGKVFGKEPEVNTVYGRLAHGGDESVEVEDHLQAMDGVETVVSNTATIENYRQMLSSVDLVMVVLIAAAAVLAFVVLYNLVNINIAERTREIASLKVLGFLPKEVCAYIFREIILIVLVGALVGLVLGVWFEGYVIITAEMDSVMFGRTIHWPSFLYAFLLTMGFCVLVLGAMTPKLKSVDMVESLKSVE